MSLAASGQKQLQLMHQTVDPSAFYLIAQTVSHTKQFIHENISQTKAKTVRTEKTEKKYEIQIQKYKNNS